MRVLRSSTCVFKLHGPTQFLAVIGDFHRKSLQIVIDDFRAAKFREIVSLLVFELAPRFLDQIKIAQSLTVSVNYLSPVTSISVENE